MGITYKDKTDVYILYFIESLPIYVGVTGDLTKRLKNHIRNAKKGKSSKDCFINHRLNFGFELKIKSIDKCTDFSWYEKEKYWIKKYRDMGFKQETP